MKGSMGLLRNVLLVVGGCVIIAAALFTLTHLTDIVVYTVLIPGIVAGLILIGLYVALGGQHGRKWPGSME